MAHLTQTDPLIPSHGHVLALPGFLRRSLLKMVTGFVTQTVRRCIVAIVLCSLCSVLATADGLLRRPSGQRRLQGDAKPFIWKVEDTQRGEVAAYLVGTIHLPYRLLEGPSLSLVSTLVQRAHPDAFLLEVNVTNKELPSVPLNNTLKHHLKEYPDVQEKLNAFYGYLQRFSSPFSMMALPVHWAMTVEMMPPLFATASLSLLLEFEDFSEELMASGGLTVDGYVASLGRQSEGVGVGGIETVSEVMDLVFNDTDISFAEQMHFLNATLTMLEVYTKHWEDKPPPMMASPNSPLVHAWKSGDEQLLGKLVSDEGMDVTEIDLVRRLPSSGESVYTDYFDEGLVAELEALEGSQGEVGTLFKKKLLAERNQLWIRRMRHILQHARSDDPTKADSPCRPLFVFAFGVGHFLAESDSVLDLLRDAGYKVTRVERARQIPRRGSNTCGLSNDGLRRLTQGEDWPLIR
mmetsp:Transcript_32868/g.94858  ORF Transcript_32868/g.94858 Transcript_32868/m.94858 type:complete len:463 (+) Transcript_32868:42-1430(+)